MRNRKGAIEISVGTVLIIVLGVSMVILGVFFIEKVFGEPEFRITKEECREERVEVGETLYPKKIVTQELFSHAEDSVGVICRFYDEETNWCGKAKVGFDNVELLQIYEKWDCSDWKIWWEGEIRKEEKIERWCFKNHSLDSIDIITGSDEYGTNYEYYLKKGFKFPTFLVWNHSRVGPQHETTEVCEQVEVDWIFYFQEGYEDCKSDGCLSDYSILMLKRELTTEWLDENAKCDFCEVDWEDKKLKGKSSVSCDEVCKIWKLNDYTIEVIK